MLARANPPRIIVLTPTHMPTKPRASDISDEGLAYTSTSRMVQHCKEVGCLGCSRVIQELEAQELTALAFHV